MPGPLTFSNWIVRLKAKERVYDCLGINCLGSGLSTRSQGMQVTSTHDREPRPCRQRAKVALLTPQTLAITLATGVEQEPIFQLRAA